MAHPSPWLDLSVAIEQCLASVPVKNTSETVKLDDALGRVVAQDIVSKINVPPWDNSAMDGYAVNTQHALASASLPIDTVITAGMAPDHSLGDHSVTRIMTGAPIPAGADAVIMQENTEKNEELVTILQAAVPGENIRRQGSDIEVGQTIVSKGTVLAASHLMLLASIGLADIQVLSKLKVGVLATGDELCQPGQDKAVNQIYESNRTGVKALLSEYGVDVVDYGIVGDTPDDIRAVFARAATQVDLIISSGGVSVGDADFVKQIIAELGEINFWKVAIKPGKPFAFGHIGKAVFCGLPGNPVSAYVTCQQIVLPVISHMQGRTEALSKLTVTATLKGQVKRRAGRQEFIRALASQSNTGELFVTPLAKQSSGVMSTVTQANCYLLVDKETAHLRDGDPVSVQLFDTRGLTVTS